MTKSSDDRLLQLLYSVHADIDSKNFDILDFVYATGSPLSAWMYSCLFWPNFVEFEGMVFRESVASDEEFQARVREALAKSNGDLRDVEESFSILELPYDAFARLERQLETEDLYALAERIREMWAARLKTLFPSRTYVVAVGDVDSDKEEPCVTFYQVRYSIQK